MYLCCWVKRLIFQNLKKKSKYNFLPIVIELVSIYPNKLWISITFYNLDFYIEFKYVLFTAYSEIEVE